MAKKIFLLCVLALGLFVTPAWAASNHLSWTDNSNNESTFHIERTTAPNVAACLSAGGFTEIGTTLTNVTTFDDSSVLEGITYCYRVRASNANGFSDYSNIAGRTVPLGAPSGLSVTSGP